MKHIGLMFAMDAEMNFFAALLENPQQKTMHQRTFYTGVVGDKIITAVISGMGKVNAAICTADLINIFKADMILNIGISGGLDSSLKIGDFVVGTDIVYHDVWCGNPNKYGQVQGLPEMYHSVPELTAKLTKYRRSVAAIILWKKPKHYKPSKINFRRHWQSIWKAAQLRKRAICMRCRC